VSQDNTVVIDPQEPSQPNPSPQPVAAAIDRATVEKALSILTKVLAGAAMFSNNEWLKKISVALEQLLTKDWFVDLLMEVLTLFEKNASEEEIHAAVVRHMTRPA